MPDLANEWKELQRAGEALKKAKDAEEAAENDLNAAHKAMLDASLQLLRVMQDPHATKEQKAAAAKAASAAGKADEAELKKYSDAKEARKKAQKRYRKILLDFIDRLLSQFPPP